jgi:hypothetical protein
MGHNSNEKIVRNSQIPPVFFMKDSQVTHFFKCATSFIAKFQTADTSGLNITHSVRLR